MEPGITVVIPTIPPRGRLLQRAITSVSAAAYRASAAGLPPVSMVSVTDFAKKGAAATRHRGLMDVSTEWVAFLDDDDELLPHHLVRMFNEAQEHQADFLWSRFQISLDHQVFEECWLTHCSAQHRFWDHPLGHIQIRKHLVERPQLVQGPQFLGEKAFQQWNDNDPCQTTITTMVRTEVARAAGGFEWQDGDAVHADEQGNRRGEDFAFALRCRATGAVMRHVPEVTWTWHHHASNTSGLPTW